MARMTLRVVDVDGDRRRVPLSERIVDENLGSYRHVPRPREQLRSATADEGSSSRNRPSLLRTITTVVLGLLKRVIRQPGARDVAPTAASTKKSSWTWRGSRRGLTQVCAPVAGSLAARLKGGLSSLAGAARMAGARRALFGAGG